MKSPANLPIALHQLNQLMGKRLNGSSVVKREHRQRLFFIVREIYRRTQRGPMQITWNNLRSELDKALNQYGQEDASELFTSVYQLACLRGKAEHWLPHLYGRWGRPGKKGALPMCLAKERQPSALFKR